MKNRIWVGFTLLVALALSACQKPAAEAEKEPESVAHVSVAKVELQQVKETVDLDGQFGPSEGSLSKLAFAVSGRVTVVKVKEGDHVVKGQILALEDLRSTQSQALSAASARTAAASQADAARIGLEAAQADQLAQVRLAESTLKSAQEERDADVKQADAELQILTKGARPQEIAKAQEDVAQARINKEKAKVAADRNASLLKDGLVSGQEAADSKAAFELASSEFDQAVDALSLLKEGARPEERKAAQDKLDAAKKLGDQKILQARLALDQAKKSALMVRAKAADAESVAVAATQKQHDLETANAAVSGAIIRAPFAGTVVKRTVNPGDVADPTVPSFEVAREGSSTDFVASASPSSASKVAVGMQAQVGDSMGTVSAVGGSPNASGLVSIRIKIEGHRTTGEFAVAKIAVHTYSQTPVIPRAALVRRESGEVVFVVDGDKAKMVQVETGPTMDDKVAVMKGLKGDETVILVGAHELSDGASIEVESK